MTPEQWLIDHAKKPYNTGNNGFWHWAPDDEGFSAEDEDYDFSLPLEIFNRLRAKTTYPSVKTYWSEEEALQDFHRAWMEVYGGEQSTTET